MKQHQRILTGVIGSSLEWYDFALYGSFANLIAKLFFPSSNPLNGILATFGIFALGFFMRPIGGLLFGHFGDRIGRSKVLIITIFGMTFPTVLIAILPSYNHIGIAAPILLLFARLIQGLVIGGEYTGALLFLAEHVEADKRGQIASFAMISALGGMLFGSMVAALFTSFVSHKVLEAWAWRIPFLSAIVLGAIGYRLRRFMSESPVFLELIRQSRIVSKPAVVVFKEHWRFVLLAIGICVMTGTTQYLMFTFFPSYIQSSAHLPLALVLRINTLGMIIMLITIPIFARLSDRIGRRPVLKISAFGFLLLSAPVFLLLSQHNVWLVFLGVSIFAFLIGIASAPMAGLYIELFPTVVRYSGIAISYNIAFAIFAGTAPMTATLLMNLLHDKLAPVLLVIIATLISLMCFYLMPETAGSELKH